MKVVYANTTTHVASSRGHTVLLVIGTHWPDNDPLVKAHPELFSDDARFGLNFSSPPVEDAAPIEQATAVPGEKRNVKRG